MRIEAINTANEGKKRERQEKIELRPLKNDGDKLIEAIEAGGMGAVLSGMEIMYIFLYRGKYQCFIHEFDSEEGRHREFDVNERNRAMFKNLHSAADQLFEIRFKPDMDFMGVMVAAERGIIGFLDSTGQLPAEDVDFMSAFGDTKGEQE